MKVFTRATFLILILNLNFITLPEYSFANNKFKWLRLFKSENPVNSSTNLLGNQTIDLVESINRIYHASSPYNEEDADNIDHESVSNIDILSGTDKIVNAILSSSLQCNGYSRFKKFFGIRNALEAKKRKTGEPPLIAGAKAGSLRIVSELLKKGVGVNDQDSYGNTALMWAVKNKNPDMVALLLYAGADITLKNRDKNNALSIALNKYQQLSSENEYFSDAPEEEIVVKLLVTVLNKKLQSKIKIDGQDIHTWIFSDKLDADRRENLRTNLKRTLNADTVLNPTDPLNALRPPRSCLSWLFKCLTGNKRPNNSNSIFSKRSNIFDDPHSSSKLHNFDLDGDLSDDEDYYTDSYNYFGDLNINAMWKR